MRASPSRRSLPLIVVLCCSCFPWFAGAVQGPAATFSCSADSAAATCDAYIAYRTREPDYLDVGSISDLFGVSRLSIVQATGLASEDERLSPGQIVLVPASCGCGGNNYSLTNFTYEIKQGDSYYHVSIGAFENLTEWHLVEEANPSLIPSLLPVGSKVVFPLYCKCPSRTLLDEGLEFLVTYVWESGDTVQSVAETFNATPNIIQRENTDLDDGKVVGHPVVIPLSQPPVITQPNVRRHSKRSIFSHRWVLLMVTTIAASAFTLVLIASLLYIHLQQKEAEEHLNRDGSMMEDPNLIQERVFSIDVMSDVKSAQAKLLTEVSDYLGKPIIYQAREIMDATRNLSDRLRIGRSIYQGMIEDKVFAVKVSTWREAEELKISQRVNHSNLVRLVGVSSDQDRSFFLVYEYAENGSLDKWLFENPNSNPSMISFLNWNQRLQIALDIAKGLQYMHEHAQPSIVHGNIKARNILLDSTFKAKISNFSTARLATSPLTLKADVLAFGIILLELLAGRKFQHPKGINNTSALQSDVAQILKEKENREDRLKKWIDPKLFSLYPTNSTLSMLAIAKACTEAESFARPSMSEVVFSLSVLAQSISRTLQQSQTIRSEAEK
ncbi:hypothetical protein MLD38_030888 [Melastoma candidum]|uniref:Uncharacterized protein n=1 Tax=Melastoma candidum TaxID=119954 RepID=A0ACB9MMH8_9MYRT|nr:hypothetical protein MLD38_030888 [Melastoma candidum]